MKNKMRVPVFPNRKYDIISEDNKKKCRFMMYTENDANKFEEILDNTNELEFFNKIDKFFKEKREIFRINELEFKYTILDYIGMGSAFILTDETSTWNKDYND
jgi:hypothetical protein